MSDTDKRLIFIDHQIANATTRHQEQDLLWERGRLVAKIAAEAEAAKASEQAAKEMAEGVARAKRAIEAVSRGEPLPESDGWKNPPKPRPKSDLEQHLEIVLAGEIKMENVVPPTNEPIDLGE